MDQTSYHQQEKKQTHGYNDRKYIYYVVQIVKDCFMQWNETENSNGKVTCLNLFVQAEYKVATDLCLYKLAKSP